MSSKHYTSCTYFRLKWPFVLGYIMRKGWGVQSPIWQIDNFEWVFWWIGTFHINFQFIEILSGKMRPHTWGIKYRFVSIKVTLYRSDWVMKTACCLRFIAKHLDAAPPPIKALGRSAAPRFLWSSVAAQLFSLIPVAPIKLIPSVGEDKIYLYPKYTVTIYLQNIHAARMHSYKSNNRKSTTETRA